MSVNIPKSLAFDQLPTTNIQPLQPNDSISLVTFKLPYGAHPGECDYIYSHERLGRVLLVNPDGSFVADMESISGNVTRHHKFTVSQLNRVTFVSMAHIIYKLNN